MQTQLDESNFQAELDEDDELLIQLAAMLNIQAGAYRIIVQNNI